MPHRTIQHEIHVDATPEVVFDVVSNPAHLAQWFPDHAELDPVAGGSGVFRFDTPGGEQVAPVTVVEAEPFFLFSFRWSRDEREPATASNALLVRFELAPAGGGTLLRMTESNFDGRGLGDARVLADYEDHLQGWSEIMPRLAPYAERVGARA